MHVSMMRQLSKMVQNGQYGQNGEKLSKWYKMVQNGLSDKTWQKIIKHGQNGLKWSKMV